MPWIDNEAKALKAKLAGLTVTDAASTDREVGVWFRNPETELRDMTFPSIVLEYSGLNKADDREHRGTTTLGYIPEEFQPGPYDSVDEVSGVPVVFDPGAVSGEDFNPTYSPFKVPDFPIPYNLDFQITVYSRLQQELTPLIGQLSKIDRIPVRFGYLEVPEDGTTRSMDLLAGPEIVSSRDPEGRRLFQAVYSVRIYTELNLYDVQQISKRISGIDLNLQSIPVANS
jgi:hypothetical protein